MNKTERRKMYRHIANILENGTSFSGYICVEIAGYVEQNFQKKSIRFEQLKLESLLGVPELISGRAWLSHGHGPIGEEIDTKQKMIGRKIKVLRLLASGRRNDLIMAKKIALPSISHTLKIHGVDQ